MQSAAHLKANLLPAAAAAGEAACLTQGGNANEIS